MNFKENINLANLTTIKLGLGKAKRLVEITNKEQIRGIYKYARENNLPTYILGEGSNSIATDSDFPGIILKNELKGIKAIELGDDKKRYEVASGEIWDDFVSVVTKDGMTGLEATAGIPGTVGATPVQNVGAYGQEIAESLVEAEVYDAEKDKFITLTKADLGFGYRTSELKRGKNKNFFVTRVTYELKKGQLSRPFYWSLEKYVTDNGLTDFSPKKISQYVKAVRSIRIPDYKIQPSAGSFFENAEVLPEKFEQIKSQFPDIPYGNPMPNGLIKIPTAWMIEKTGLPGKVIRGIEITPFNPMILVNKSARTYSDLLTARQEIKDAVKELFGIELEQEPIEIR